MFLISHRGNTLGQDIANENKPKYINNTLQKGYNVEVDVWFLNNKFYLGHDTPQYEVNKSFLKNDKLWCHAKNLDGLFQLRKINARYFWHENDKVTITSNGYFWTYPGQKLEMNSICVMPELNQKNFASIGKMNISGVCSDYIEAINEK